MNIRKRPNGSRSPIQGGRFGRISFPFLKIMKSCWDLLWEMLDIVNGARCVTWPHFPQIKFQSKNWTKIWKLKIWKVKTERPTYATWADGQIKPFGHQAIPSMARALCSIPLPINRYHTHTREFTGGLHYRVRMDQQDATHQNEGISPM